MMLRETPNNFIGAKVEMTEMGIERPTMIVAVRFLRKIKRMMMARIPPITAVDLTSFTAFSINTD